MGSEPGSGAGARHLRVAVTGAGSSLGRRVCQQVVADPAVDAVVALDVPGRVAPRGTEGAGLDLAGDDLDRCLDGTTTLVHLVEPGGGDRGARRRGAGPVDIARRVLDAATGVRHAVVLSSALAYGARPDNPVPLTEGAPLRPNRGVTVAQEALDVEALVEAWRSAHPAASVAVLRPTVVVAPDANGFLARALRRSVAVPGGEVEPPAQFLHLDDLVGAIDLARRTGLDGPFNVAPDGWADGDVVRALAGGPPVRLPGWAATAVVRTGWRWGVGATPPELLPYVRHPWVVANDRLRAEGWVPEHTSEEAYVAAHAGGPLATMSPRHRHELALGAAGAALAAAAAITTRAIRKRR